MSLTIAYDEEAGAWTLPGPQEDGEAWLCPARLRRRGHDPARLA
ncbi:hypothetical protein [Streptomyces sp. NPDC048142]